jgi:hypothetical protein
MYYKTNKLLNQFFWSPKLTTTHTTTLYHNTPPKLLNLRPLALNVGGGLLDPTTPQTNVMSQGKIVTIGDLKVCLECLSDVLFK